MNTDIEVNEYKKLCSTLRDFHEKYQSRKEELRKLLEETLNARRDALLVLAKANKLTRHLNAHQRQTIGLSYQLGDIKARINQGSSVLKNLALFQGPGEEKENLPDIREDFRSRRELKQMGILILGRIDNVRKKILQLDILELRCRELKLSIKKAVEAFCHEWRKVRRNIYPFGIFSRLSRSLRGFFGRSYFSSGDMKDLTALGSITCYVLKIADSPIA